MGTFPDCKASLVAQHASRRHGNDTMALINEASYLAVPAQRVRIPICIKITLPYLVLSIILAVAAAYMITQLIVENVEERFNKQLYEAGKISAELGVSYESQLLETERLLANVEGAAIAIRDRDQKLDVSYCTLRVPITSSPISQRKTARPLSNRG